MEPSSPPKSERLPSDLPSEQIPGGRYHMVKRLSTGALGAVYMAVDTILDRSVAVKVVRLDTPFADHSPDEIRERFVREARVAARLQHSNIVTIHDIVADTNRGFIVMEFIEGQSLESLLKERKRLSLSESIRIIEQLGSALDYAHARNVVHRDVKPSNILVAPSSSVWVTDFGVAKSELSTNLTMAGGVLGTPDYMSPEQAKGEDVDARSDLFSLGCILFECAIGEKPFRSPSLTGVLLSIINDEPVFPLNWRSLGLPAALKPVLHHALEKNRERRFASGQDLVAALRKLPVGDIEKADAAVAALASKATTALDPSGEEPKDAESTSGETRGGEPGTQSKDETAAKPEEPAAAKLEEPAATKLEEPAATKLEEPAATKSEEPVATKSEEPVATKSEEPVATKSEEPVATKSEEPVATKSEEPVATKSEEPVAEKSGEPVATKPEEAAATKSEEPVATKSEEPVATKSGEPAEAKSEGPVAAKSEEPAVAKSKEPVSGTPDEAAAASTEETLAPKNDVGRTEASPTRAPASPRLPVEPAPEVPAEKVTELKEDTRLLKLSPTLSGALQDAEITPEEGFLLSRIDGVSRPADIMAMSPMPEPETARVLFALLEKGLINRGSAERAPKAKPAPKVRITPAKSDGDHVDESTIKELDRLLVHASAQDHAQLLGVEKNAPEKTRKSAYLKIIGKFHPDKFSRVKDSAFKEKLSRVCAAAADAVDELAKIKPEPTGSPTRPPTNGASSPAGGRAFSGQDTGSFDRKRYARELYDRALRAFDIQDFWDAIQLCQQAIEADDQQAEYFFLLGRALMQNRRWRKDAANNFRKASELDPRNLDYLGLLGALYQSEGLTARASSILKQAQTLDPDYTLPELDGEPTVEAH